MAKAIAKNTRSPLTKNPRSAVSSIRRSGYELVPRRKRRGKLATYRDIAKMDFRPWTPEKGLFEFVSNFEDRIRRFGVPVRIAYRIMERTKRQLSNIHGRIEHEHVDGMMASLFEAAEVFKEIAAILDAAYIRVLSSASARVIAGRKFKGVDAPRTKRAA
jgi:hypothetical protein